MDALDLARLQFAVTTVYHFFFVPLTLGLSILTAIMQTMWLRTNNDKYKQMAKFWGKLFVINFAMGVVTGIVMEFQFGMNWSQYSRFMGDIFGVPLAIEALMAFFLESTFIGIWIFGWDKLPRAVHTLTIWMVAIGANISALWILIANSFMQEPVGFTALFEQDGQRFTVPATQINETIAAGATLLKVQMDSFGDLITNPNVLVQYPHVFTAGMTTAAFFVLGVSAWHLLRNTERREFFLSSVRIATVYGLIGVVLVIMVGHSQAQHMVETQPMKMAAAEGLFYTEDNAGLSLFTIGNWEQRDEVFSIRIPGALSLLAYNRFGEEVQGIHDLNAQYKAEYADRYGPDADYIPPVAASYWSFRAMVGAGFAMLAIALFALYLGLKEQITRYRWFLLVMMYALLLPYIANTGGWLLTELGRQPWIVMGLQRTEEAVSPNVTTGMVALSLVLFTLVYGALMAADVYLLAKFGRRGPVEHDPDESPAGSADPGLVAA